MKATKTTRKTVRSPAPFAWFEIVSSSIVEALRDEIEDVCPGDAVDVARGLQFDPKGTERRFAGFVLGEEGHAS